MNKSTETIEKRIQLIGIDPFAFYGTQDTNLRFLEKYLEAHVIARGNEITLRGNAKDVDHAEKIVNELIYMINRKGAIEQDDIETLTRLSDWKQETFKAPEPDSAIYYTRKGVIKPKTNGQKEYWRTAKENDISIIIGPAGTGKTFMAVAIALASLRDKRVDRIVLCRPAVEAGESLGFLPGDYRDKVDPYLRPLYDALFDMVPIEKLEKQIQNKIIEIVPLAYMRGRTLNHSFVILDEAQNTTSGQMKMFLTRLGPNSRAIVTGDITQIDLPPQTVSGLIEIQRILDGIDGIGFVYLDEGDVVRHRLVREIIKAYESSNNHSTDTENESNQLRG